MIKHFYSYHVEIDSLIIEIESFPIKDHEKKHLIQLAESQIYHTIIDSVLSELNSEDKKAFLEHLNSKNHERIWNFLRSKVKDVEGKINEAAIAVKKELYKDIRELRVEK